jgi:phage terminase large subunit-like protein
LHQKKLHLRRGLMGTKIILKHLREFPTGSHDDGADALAIAYRHVYGDDTTLLAAA